jgi:hypothetical protein
MKKLTLLIILFLLATNMFAQEITTPTPVPEYYKHEVGITYGAFAQPITMPYPYHLLHPILIGSINIDYYYNFNKRHSIGVALSFTSDYLNEHSNPFPLSDNVDFSNFLSIQLGYRMIYFQKEKISLYFSFFVGTCPTYTSYLADSYTNAHTGWNIMPIVCHLTAFGMTIGKRNCATIELGVGTKGILQVGYKYRFNPKKTK